MLFNTHDLFLNFLSLSGFTCKTGMHACVLSLFSHVRFFATLGTVALQAPLSMEFSRQEYLSVPPPGDLPDSGIEFVSPVSPALAGEFFTMSTTWEVQNGNEGEVTQSCPTLGDPVDCSQPGSSVQGILQARILEWVAISFSRGSSRPRDRTHVSCIGRWILYP